MRVEGASLFWYYFHLQEAQGGRRALPLKPLSLCNLINCVFNSSLEENSSSGGCQKS